MWDWVNISFHTFVIVKMSNSYDWIAIKNIIPVAKVKGIALLINFSNPALKSKLRALIKGNKYSWSIFAPPLEFSLNKKPMNNDKEKIK